jgi:hypothetical protein
MLAICRYRTIADDFADNAMSWRAIAGEKSPNSPQVRIRKRAGAYALGIAAGGSDEIGDVGIQCRIQHTCKAVLTSAMGIRATKWTYGERVDCFTRSLYVPQGVFLMTGTSRVPSRESTLRPQNLVLIQVGEQVLENRVFLASRE